MNPIVNVAFDQQEIDAWELIAQQTINYTNPLIIITNRQNLPGLPANRHTIENDGQGNCLYYSVQQGLEAIGINRGDHTDLRRASMNLVLNNRRDYQDDCRLYLNATVSGFHQHFRRSGIFGQDMSIIALVDFLRVNVIVHYRSEHEEDQDIHSHSVATFSPTGGSLHTIEIICHVHRYHYECVLPGAAPVGIQAILPTPSATEALFTSSSSSNASSDSDEEFSENISIAAPRMLAAIAESDGSDEEELFIVEGRKRRAVKSDPSKETLKRAKIVQIQRPVLAGARFTKEVVSLSETGVLKFDGRQVIKYDKPTMDLIKKLDINLSKLSVKNSSGAYIYYGKDGLHSVLGAALKQKHFDYLVKRGFTGSIDNLTDVSHLDDNALNNNTSNLLNLPSAWNQNLKKAKGARPAGKKWIQQVVIAESDPYNTVSVSDPDEALLQYDILKTKHSLDHVFLCPKLAQQIIFKYGLVRPRKFVNLGYYKSIKTLLSHQNDWTKSNCGPKKGSKQKYRLRFRLLDLKDPDVTEAIHAALNKPGNLPFDALIHVIFEYVGRKVRHQRIVNRDFYESSVEPYTGAVYQDTDGYLDFTKVGKLHNLALGRKRGDHAKDKLQGCHGVGGILDNRTHKKSDGKLDGRTLTLGPGSTNLSHIVRKHAGSTSQIHGLSKPKNGNVRVQIKFGGTQVQRSYRDEVYGAASRRHLEENRNEIELELVNVTDHKQRMSIIAAHFLKEGRTGAK